MLGNFRHLEGSGVKIQLQLWDSIQLRNSSDKSHQSTSSHIVVSRNLFQNLASFEGIGVSLRVVHTGRNVIFNCRVPVILGHNTFFRNLGLQYGGILDLILMLVLLFLHV